LKLINPPHTAATRRAFLRGTQRTVSGGGKSAMVSTSPSGPTTWETELVFCITRLSRET
jgi:hypothetical protein